MSVWKNLTKSVVEDGYSKYSRVSIGGRRKPFPETGTMTCIDFAQLDVAKFEGLLAKHLTADELEVADIESHFAFAAMFMSRTSDFSLTVSEVVCRFRANNLLDDGGLMLGHICQIVQRGMDYVWYGHAMRLAMKLHKRNLAARRMDMVQQTLIPYIVRNWS
jgi:hypothetical protein